MIGLVHIQRAGRREFQIVGATSLKMWVGNKEWTNGMGKRLVFDKLRERVE